MLPDLKIAEWLIIGATILGPVLAVQAQKFIERARETRQRKLRLFYILMSTRAARVSADHVQALNMIDIEFYGQIIFGIRLQTSKEKHVIESWRIYQDHLNQQVASDAITVWATRSDEFFTDLLFTISIALGYNFDKVQLKRGIYSPRAHGEQEDAQLVIRDSLVKILSGERALPMAVTSIPTSKETVERQQQLQGLLLDYLSGKKSLRVTIDEESK